MAAQMFLEIAKKNCCGDMGNPRHTATDFDTCRYVCSYDAMCYIQLSAIVRHNADRHSF